MALCGGCGVTFAARPVLGADFEEKGIAGGVRKEHVTPRWSEGGENFAESGSKPVAVAVLEEHSLPAEPLNARGRGALRDTCRTAERRDRGCQGVSAQLVGGDGNLGVGFPSRRSLLVRRHRTVPELRESLLAAERRG